MVTGEKLREALQKYIPERAVDDCVEWIREYKISVRIKHSRASKYGDYRPPQDGKSHIITINHDLNPYAFLITFTHEVAHLTCFLKNRGRVLPHGEEWKNDFRILLSKFIYKNVFPEDVSNAVNIYLKNPAASSCSDLNLMKVLKKYDIKQEGWMHLDEIPYQGTFMLSNGMKFIKGTRLRKNFECFEQESNHKYFIHPLMEVKLLD